ncbi:MAG: DUF1223 domain-containing protein [Hyphomicrobiaceae bacterium]
MTAAIAVMAATGFVRAGSLHAAELTPPGGADKQPGTVSAVIELFTSQGCSSCPPADRLLESYAKRRDVMALSYPVDYWDYLGWQDTLASEKNSERQRDYAKTRGDGSVYTPQVVVNGAAHAVGSDRSDIEKQIAKTALKFAAKRVAMRFWRTSNMIIVQTASAPANTNVTEATIWLAPVRDKVEVEIQHGENRGKTLKYFNVVHELMPIGVWTGKAMQIQLAAMPFLRPGSTRYAVLMQEGTTGPIVGAAWLGW